MRVTDIIIVAAYLCIVMAVGIACRGRERSVNAYFTGHGLFHGWFGTVLVGFSIAATFFSGISLVIYISSVYSDGIQIGAGLLIFPLAWVVLRWWFFPRFFAEKWEQPYDIIEHWMGRPVRVMMSGMFILLRIGWMGVLIYAPALIIMGTANLGNEWLWPVVLAIGLTSTVYTVIGGIRSVILTDAIQFVIIAGGMLFIGLFLFFRIDLNAGEMVRELSTGGRLEWLNFSFDPTITFTFWSVIFGVGVKSIALYLADQMSLQRYLASESPATAMRSFTINVIGAMFVLTLLIGIGLLLWLWYRHHPDAALPDDPDLIISYFISRELPVGVAGLLIAAIMAATMSSMTSGISALAGAVTNDWVARLGRTRSPEVLFRIGRWVSLGLGVLATIMAGFVDRLGSLLVSSQIILGLFYGPMLGCMCLAVIGRRFKSAEVMTGLAVGVLAGAGVVWSPGAGLWVSPVGFLVSVLVPMGLSAVRKSNEGTA